MGEGFGTVFLNTCIALGILMLVLGVVYTIWTQHNLKKKRAYNPPLHSVHGQSAQRTRHQGSLE